MPVHVPSLRRPPTLAERLLGRRRARILRRRAGFLAVVAAFSLLRPRPRRWPRPAVGAAVVLPVVLAALAVTAR